MFGRARDAWQRPPQCGSKYPQGAIYLILSRICVLGAMLAVRSFSSMASFVLTTGLLALMVSSLASSNGLNGQHRSAALHAFDVASLAKAPDRPAAKPAPARAVELAQQPVRRDAAGAMAGSLRTIDLRATLPLNSPTVSPPDGFALGAAHSMRQATDPAIASVQPVGSSAPSASQPHAETNAYSALVLAWLKRHQHFPEAQVRDALDATVLVAFTLDHRGRAGEVRVVRGSGIAWLDALAIRQVRSASPFPRPLKSAPAETISFEVPMRYRARG